ncbi:O-acetylhomoserine aminocarboxypropyltransferase/cysteine synthase family protein [uncultured Amnibacterium sp.]|uniref:O-acetylhomoserine aminocarboxypropyltransferase/cysteine synthase family protein n=1 Tax=uncultured Amnibacterium sp. TaxID=1631851 RepID=UPI0035CB6497
MGEVDAAAAGSGRVAPIVGGFTTEQVHGGALPDAAFGSRVPPIYLSAGFVFDDFEQARDRFDGDESGYTYTRLGNPTNAAVERRIAGLERGAEAILVGSGQAAVTVAMLGLLQAGDHLLSAGSIYEGSRNLFLHNFARFGIEVEFVDNAADPAEWVRRIRPTTRALFGESIPNPKNDLLDIRMVADIAHRAGLPLVVDNTLATPYLVRPIEHGADVVVHSASKFLAGHGTAIGGVVVDAGRFDWAGRSEEQGPSDQHGRFRHLTEPDRILHGASYVERYGRRAYIVYARDIVASRLGPSPSPFNAFLIQQGIETLSLRVERHCANALAVARWLERQPEVLSVDYAGLDSSPYRALADRYLPRGAGSVFAFTLDGGEPAAKRFVNAVALFSRMTHLGDVRSLILHPASTTHAHRAADELRTAGIGPGLLRLSIGIEDVDDLILDLQRGLAAVRAPAVREPADTARDRLVRSA